MPTSLQKKIMHHLEKITKEAGLDFVEQPEYANTGTVYLQDGFKTVLSFCYHFDDHCIDLQWYPEGVITKRSSGFLKDTRCILNITSDLNSLSESIESCEKLIETVAIPKKTKCSCGAKES